MKILKLAVMLLLGLTVVMAVRMGAGMEVEAQEEVRFNRDIRPLLSDRCFFCHGPDEKNRKAGLRLDTFEGATRDRGGYRAVSPGKPEESELLRRVTSHEPFEMMPPPAAKRRRSPRMRPRYCVAGSSRGRGMRGTGRFNRSPTRLRRRSETMPGCATG